MRRRTFLVFYWSWLFLATASFLSADPWIRLEPVASGFVQPVFLTHAGDGSGRLLVVEQGGRIWIVENGQRLSTPFLDIRDRVDSGGEKGLLGLAFHPKFAGNGRFFVNYTRSAPLQTVIAEYQVMPGDPNRAAPNEKILLTYGQPFSNHNGGMIAFGPDGYLYIASGDGGSGGDPFGNGQRSDTLLGKILRIGVDRGAPFAIPPDNPFAGQSGAREEIWAYGLRNPWRFSFDRSGGRLFVADVGQNSREEVDIVVRGGNYGWNLMEGTRCFPPSRTTCDSTGLIAPIFDYGRSEGGSVTGGYVYRGGQETPLYGSYLFGDYLSGKIWALTEGPGGRWEVQELLNSNLAISSFGEDETGELYVLDHGGGQIFRIRFGWRERFAHAGDGLSPAGIFRSTVLINNNTDRTLSGSLEPISKFQK